jgi:hypothetical protein
MYNNIYYYSIVIELFTSQKFVKTTIGEICEQIILITIKNNQIMIFFERK